MYKNLKHYIKTVIIKGDTNLFSPAVCHAHKYNVIFVQETEKSINRHCFVLLSIQHFFEAKHIGPL